MEGDVSRSAPTATLASLESEARSLLAQGRSMNRNDPGSCGRRMRALQPQVMQLQVRV